MSNYQHILVPVDFSESSDRTIQKALALRDLHKAKLTLVNYVEPLPATCFGEVVSEIEEGMERTARNKIKQLAERHQIAATDIRIEIGRAKSGIPTLAKSLQADLIVIGSHGHHSALGNFFVGSTTSRVANHSPCDVFIIHHGVE